MYSMLNDGEADQSLTPRSVTLLVYRALAAASALGALAVWSSGWGASVLEMLGHAVWVGLSGWLGALIFCETMIVVFIIAQSVSLARRELDGRLPFDVPALLLPDFNDLRVLRPPGREPSY
jgi:hypothetical protein